MALLGKHAGFVLEGMKRALPLDLKDPRWRAALRAAADVVILNLRSDMGSNNAPAQRHIGVELEEALPESLFDVTACEVHVVNRIRSPAGAPQHLGTTPHIPCFAEIEYNVPFGVL